MALFFQPLIWLKKLPKIWVGMEKKTPKDRKFLSDLKDIPYRMGMTSQ